MFYFQYIFKSRNVGFIFVYFRINIMGKEYVNDFFYNCIMFVRMDGCMFFWYMWMIFNCYLRLIKKGCYY